jgi:hypothetical protein
LYLIGGLVLEAPNLNGHRKLLPVLGLCEASIWACTQKRTAFTIFKGPKFFLVRRYSSSHSSLISYDHFIITF